MGRGASERECCMQTTLMNPRLGTRVLIVEPVGTGETGALGSKEAIGVSERGREAVGSQAGIRVEVAGLPPHS